MVNAKTAVESRSRADIGHRIPLTKKDRILKIKRMKIEFVPNEKIIVIVGLAASGKSTLTDLLIEQLPEHTVFHSDDYIHYGYEEALYKMMSDIKADRNDKKIIEGVQGYRLLRKGFNTQEFIPDLVIVCQCDEVTRKIRYTGRGNKIENLERFDKNLLKVWTEYRNLLSSFNHVDFPTRIIYYDTVENEARNEF